jgi:hypothetical protein
LLTRIARYRTYTASGLGFHTPSVSSGHSQADRLKANFWFHA